jgi:TonB family protein
MAVLGLTILLASAGGSIAAVAQTEAPATTASGVVSCLNSSLRQPAPTGPVRVSSGVVAGMMLSKVTPVYPMKARILGVQGSVIMHAIISKTGTIEDLTVIGGPKLLQKAAIDAVQRWTYRPYILNCEPAEVETSITVNFTFGGAKPVPPSLPEVLHQSSEIDMLHDSPLPVVQSALAESDDAGGSVKKIGGGVSAPVLVKQVEPQFSPEAKQRKLQGVVLVSIIVDEHGRPQNVHVTRGVGHGLDENAVEAVQQYRFKPAMEDGKPVAVFLNVVVNFEIF